MKKAIIILLLISFSLGQVARIQMGNVAFTLLDLTVGVTSVAWFLFGVSKKKKRTVTFIEKLGAGFFITGILGLIFFSANLTFVQLGISLLYPLRLLVYLTLFYQVKSLKTNERKLAINGLTVAGSSIIIVGLIQFLLYPALKNLYYLGWDDHLYRLFSVFLDPNFAGAFFALFICYILELFAATKRIGMRITYGCILGAALLSELLTHSRTGFIMLLIGVGVFLLSYAGKKVTLGVLAICLILFILLANPNTEGLNPFRTASSNARISSIGTAFSIIKTYPVVGVGFDAYRYAQIKMGYRQENPKFPSHADAGTDNSYLFVLATTGVVGFVMFCLFLSKMVIWARERGENNIFLGRSLFAALCSLLIGSLFLNSIFYPMIIAWIVVQAGLLTQSKKS